MKGCKLPALSSERTASQTREGVFYLQVELLSGCTKSLQYIQRRVAAIHIFRVEVALNKLTGLFFDPGLYFVSAKNNCKHMFTPQPVTDHSALTLNINYNRD